MNDDDSSAPEDVSPTADTAFDRLLQDVARISLPGRVLWSGAQLCQGRFVIRRRLGAGGMGVVFEALDTQAGSTVALKTLSRVDAAGIYRMKREFRSLARVVHPRLVPPRELFADDDLWFFTMDLIDGVPFNHYVRSSGAGLDESQLRAALAQLVSGVQAIHDAGQLHRDLKPTNVLVAEGPQLAVLDFGLATEAAAPSVTQSVEHARAGTPAYMAPEQAHGRSATTASDWYAVGVMLFEALTGRLPYEGPALDQLAAKQIRPAPTVRSLARDAPPDLAELSDALLAIDPKQRPGVADILHVSGPDTGEPAVSHRSGVPSRDGSSGSASDLTHLTVDLAGTFVGRSRELGLLDTALADTNEGRPVIVHVRGPSGIGKTTFVEHFLAAARAGGDVVALAGRCYERESVPFKAFDGLIDALSRHLMRLPAVEAARLAPRNAQALARIFPVLGRAEAIGAAPQRRALPHDAVELRLRAFDALKELLCRLAEERPLILAIDDLQWSDSDSARLLKHLLAPPDAPLLLLVTAHRDDEPDAEGLVAIREALEGVDSELDVRRIDLGALSLTESRRLAHKLLPVEAGEHVERIAQEGAGSPFLIGELARAADHGERPGDLRHAILTRIDELSKERRDVVLALCVAAHPVMPELLSRVVPHADVPEALRDVVAKRLGREVAGGDISSAQRARRVAPYHDRIRETVLDSLTSAERAAWHQRYVAALEVTEPLDLDALVDHTLGAGELEKAGAYARRAAKLAAEALAFDRAVTLYQTALNQLRLTDRERAELHVELAEAFIGQGRCADAARTFVEAAGLDPERAQELQRRAGEQFFINGDLDRGAGAMRQALASAGFDYDALVDPSLFMEGYGALCARGFRFEPRDAQTIDPRLLERLDTLWAFALGTAWIIASLTPITAYLREALELGEPHRIAQGRALLFTIFESSVDPVGAEARSAELYALFAALDTPATRASEALCRGSWSVATMRGDMGVAELTRAEELLSDPSARGMRRQLHLCRTSLLGAIYWTAGITAAAERYEPFLRIADDWGDRWARIDLRFVQLTLLYQRFGYERARAEFERAVELASGIDTTRLGTGTLFFGLIEAMEGHLDRGLRMMQEGFDAYPVQYGNWLAYFRWHRACVLLAAAARTNDGDRAALLERVECDADFVADPRTVLGQPFEYPALGGAAEFLRGQLAAARGDHDLARAWLETAESRLAPGLCVMGPIVRARLGDLIGGSRGAELRAEAEKVLAGAGFRPNWLELHAMRFTR